MNQEEERKGRGGKGGSREGGKWGEGGSRGGGEGCHKLFL